jgi:Ca-activated chloride channel homolog
MPAPNALKLTPTERRLSLLALAICLLLAAMFALAGQAQPVAAQAPDPIGNQVILTSHRVNVTIEDQLAITRIEQVFVNNGNNLAEGTYLFPLPEGAAVSDLTLYIDGQPYKGQILGADEARNIYNEIVRQKRDPVLLQYVGRSAVQANIFPIPAGQSRKIELTYSHFAPADNGLVNYVYPLSASYVTRNAASQVSVSVEVRGSQPIKTMYAPSAQIAFTRLSDTSFRASFEARNYAGVSDFSIFYGLDSNAISASLITYRGSANQDGFFSLIFTPPFQVEGGQRVAKDVIVVLDQSGSMDGDKWRQAQAASAYVLRNLNPEDRFNAVVFSSGYSLYANGLQDPSQADAAINWINGLQAVGGTNISEALTQALSLADPNRQTIILFLTDGVPTEGETLSKNILSKVENMAGSKTRIFVFGVGDDVDTYLLDSLSSTYRGTSVYVRPAENIEAKVSSLYNKITSPVLTALKIAIDGVTVDDLQPAASLPDLFAGSQLIVTGRYRQGGTATITLTGEQNGELRTYVYSNLNFRDNAGGQPFVARLWAQRKIGALLNQIRLGGENPELVQSVITLSVRYGIVTPYTSYLIQEDDINRVDGGAGLIPGTPPPFGTVMPMGAAPAGAVGGAAAPVSGADAVNRADAANILKEGANLAALPTAAATRTAVMNASGEIKAQVGAADNNLAINQVGDKAFINRSGNWVDTLYTEANMKVVKITFLSDGYFDLLEKYPELNVYLALGDRVLVVIDGVAYEITPEEA